MNNIYETIQGDTWDSMAFKFYHNETYADVLMRANPDKVEWFIFDAGVEIVVPDLTSIETEKIVNSFPEWRTATSSEVMTYG